MRLSSLILLLIPSIQSQILLTNQEDPQLSTLIHLQSSPTLLLNLNNKINNLDLGKGATLNIESMKGNKIKKLERHGGSTVNFGDDVSHK